jgi:hypothetical protein
MGSTRSFVANVISVKFGSFQPKLRAFGTVYGQELRADMDPSASDIDAKIRTIGKLNKCVISWYPPEYARHATLFQDAKKASEVLNTFILMASVEGYPENRATCKGAQVKNVFRDARNGEEVVELTMKSADVK